MVIRAGGKEPEVITVSSAKGASQQERFQFQLAALADKH
jgi:hypothetical protein